jgi:hypothetical protein
MNMPVDIKSFTRPLCATSQAIPLHADSASYIFQGMQ